MKTGNQRQRKQKGLDKLKAQQYYRKNRGKSKLKARQRYRTVRKQPKFKKRQKIRKKKPWLFKRKHAEVLAPVDIAFVHPDTEEIVGLRSVNPMSGMINFQSGPSDFGMIRIDRVMEEADFPSWQDIEDFYDLMDRTFLTEVEDEAFDKIDEMDEEENGVPEDEVKMARAEMVSNVVRRYLFER